MFHQKFGSLVTILSFIRCRVLVFHQSLFWFFCCCLYSSLTRTTIFSYFISRYRQLNNTNNNNMSTTVCRYSRNCRRPDCYFAHPEGRLIEQQGGAAEGRSSPQHHHDSSPSHGHHGHGGHNGVERSKNPTPCRFDRQCKRPECYFSHPNGRDIDEMYPYPGQQQQPPRHPSPATTPVVTLSNSGDADASPNAAYNRSFENFVRAHEEEREADETMMENLEESDLQDDWIPASRNCSCCKGLLPISPSRWRSFRWLAFDRSINYNTAFFSFLYLSIRLCLWLQGPHLPIARCLRLYR